MKQFLSTRSLLIVLILSVAGIEYQIRQFRHLTLRYISGMENQISGPPDDNDNKVSDLETRVEYLETIVTNRTYNNYSDTQAHLDKYEQERQQQELQRKQIELENRIESDEIGQIMDRNHDEDVRRFGGY